MNAPARFDAVAAVGGLGWAAVVAAVVRSPVALDGPVTATLAVALAVLVVVPLVARLADLPDRSGVRSRWYRSASVASLPAALAAVGSLWVPVGPFATLLALPWLLVTGLLFVFGLRRGLPNLRRPPELAVSVALWYLPVGAVALVAHRAGVTFGFGPTTMLLTVVHYHYAGSALPVFAGMVGRVRESSGYDAVLSVVVLGPGLIGLGIAFSPAVELVAATAFGVAVALLAGYALLVVWPPTGPGRGLVATATVAVVVSMGAVVGYLATRATGVKVVAFGTMLRGHGWLNAVGFALAGLVGWRLVDPASDAPPLGMPLSRLVARGRVGATYLDRNDLVADGEATGMVAGFGVFDGPALDATRIDPAVRAFYERTEAYELRVDPTWERGFRLGARLYARFGRYAEQMNFPVDDPAPTDLSSEVVAVDDRADGREDVRAWVRTYDATGAAIYVALYATHRLDGRPYMNIAFPLPFTNLTSVLAVDPLGAADPDGVVLSTDGGAGGDAGIYLRTPFGPLRLPIDETIRVWTGEMDAAFPAGVEDDGSDLFARHDMTLLGVRFLRLDYRIAEA